MGRRFNPSIASAYLAFVFLGYALIGLSGWDKNAVIVTNLFAYLFVVDPYLFIWMLGLPLFAFSSSFNGIAHFDHTSHRTIGPLSLPVLLLGVVGIAAVLTVMARIRAARYLLQGLMAFLTAAALLNVAILAARIFSPSLLDALPPIYNDSQMNGIPSIFWMASYWFAYMKINFEKDSAKSFPAPN